MRLTRLEIQQLPGISPGFTLEGLDPGINLITGPNAVGKSSLVRAFEYLLTEPDSRDPLTLSLSAELVGDEGIWTVNRTGRQVSWLCNGRPSEPPVLPGADSLHCHLLKMEELAVEGDDDQSLIDQLRQALTGGHDLRGLRQTLFPLSSRAGVAERTALQEARARLREVEAEYTGLQREEQGLPELAEQIDAARQAMQEASRLDMALTLHHVLAQRRQVESRLAAFPEGIERLRGNEGELLQRLEQQKVQLEGNLERTQQALDAATHQWRQTGLENGRPGTEDLETMRGLLDQAERWHDQWQGLRSELIRVREEERQALDALGAQRSGLAPAPEQMEEAGQLADRLEDNRRAREQIRVRQEDGERPAGEEQIQMYWQGVDVLSAWLAARDWRTVQRRVGYGLWPGMAGALTAAVLAAQQQLWWATGAAAVAAAGVGWALLTRSRDPAADARSRFRKLGLGEPEAWSGEAVRLHLLALRQEANRLQTRRDQAVSRQADVERLQALEQIAEDLEAEKSRLAAALGFDPALAGRGVPRFLELVTRQDRALVERRALEAQVAEKERSIADYRQQVQRFVQYWNGEADDSLPALAAALQTLTVRAREAERAERDRIEADRDFQRISDDLSAREADIGALYREAGLAAGDRDALQAGLEQLDEWKSLRAQLQKLEGQEVGPREALADRPDLLEAATSGEEDSLLRQRDEALQLGERYEGLREQRSNLLDRLERAGADRRLEAALHRVDQAATVYRDRLDEALFAEAGCFLLEDIEQEHQNEHEPEVLREARELFGGFTHQAWDVRVDDTGLQAFDRRQGQVRPLSELSSGTRMQLLLAVRMAWTRRLEMGRESLPLFLDEALTTSDESRFAAVASSLARLSREEGRQVFYLSARQQEPALWEQVTGEVPCRIDLADVRFGQPEAKAEDYILPTVEELPAPAGESAGDYAARLAVPPVDPDRPAGDVHVFHLLRDDLSLLYRLMSDWRVVSMGQLEGLLESDSVGTAFPDQSLRHQVAQRCTTAREWHRAWQSGRNRPVDSVVLQRSGAVSEPFLEAVSERARLESGDPEALLAALRDSERKVPRFLTRKVDELEEWLEQEGYITPGKPLTREQRLQQVLHSLGERHDSRDAARLLEWLEAGLLASD